MDSSSFSKATEELLTHLDEKGEQNYDGSESSPNTVLLAESVALQESLSYGSHFMYNPLKKTSEKQQTILVKEIFSTGGSEVRELSLRNLLDHVSKIIHEDIAKCSNFGAQQASLNESLDVGIPVASALNRDYIPARHNEAAEEEEVASTDVHSIANTAIDYVAGRLRVRDLRKVDFSFNPVEENSITVRRHAVLFCLDPIRCEQCGTRASLHYHIITAL